jgi:hypothetical protein
MSFFKPYAEVNDLIESIQAIQDNYEFHENFGKQVPSQLHFKNARKGSSYKSLNAAMAFEESTRKSFSTNSFQENEYELQNYYGKPTFMYNLEDHSTKASFSSMTSINSHSSAVSMPNNICPANPTGNAGNSKKSKGGKKKNPGEIDYRKKYKTEACKYWAEKGFCEFGDQCAFAHGNQEMRQKSYISSNYKTKKCIQFHETGYCPYGVRCQFIHSVRKDCQLNPVLEKASYIEAMENPELWVTHDPDCVCMQKRTRPRLPSFQQVSNSELSPKQNKDSNVSSPDKISYESLFLETSPS